MKNLNCLVVLILLSLCLASSIISTSKSANTFVLKKLTNQTKYSSHSNILNCNKVLQCKNLKLIFKKFKSIKEAKLFFGSVDDLIKSLIKNNVSNNNLYFSNMTILRTRLSQKALSEKKVLNVYKKKMHYIIDLIFNIPKLNSKIQSIFKKFKCYKLMQYIESFLFVLNTMKKKIESLQYDQSISDYAYAFYEVANNNELFHSLSKRSKVILSSPNPLIFDNKAANDFELKNNHTKLIAFLMNNKKPSSNFKNACNNIFFNNNNNSNIEFEECKVFKLKNKSSYIVKPGSYSIVSKINYKITKDEQVKELLKIIESKNIDPNRFIIVNINCLAAANESIKNSFKRNNKTINSIFSYKEDIKLLSNIDREEIDIDHIKQYNTIYKYDSNIDDYDHSEVELDSVNSDDYDNKYPEFKNKDNSLLYDKNYKK